MSGENISVDRSSVAANVYVVVRAESLNSCTTKMVNGDGGVHAWNEKFLLGIPSYARSVTFEVQCMNYKGVRPIGVARIALSDLLSNNTKIVSESVPQMLCYGLRNWEGRRNGVIHFSVRMVAPDALSTTKRRQLSMRNLQCASSTPTIFTARDPQGSRVTAFWGEVECLGFQLGHSGVDWLGFENVRNYI
ncbi:hypothetical protein D0Y65_017193 [Glycine soja]|uniref:C2 domain-containing protein n=1 Tax=Glycine soja TaxID=3848 RepID=A0A445JTU3_GLYSO|nr:hypothetical protein D0Y65_017193 [Glycine soja]